MIGHDHFRVAIRWETRVYRWTPIRQVVNIHFARFRLLAFIPGFLPAQVAGQFVYHPNHLEPCLVNFFQ